MVSAQYRGTEKPPPLLASDCVSVLAKDAGLSSRAPGAAASAWSGSLGRTGARRTLASTSSVSGSARNRTASTRQRTRAGTRPAGRSAWAWPCACSAWPCGK
uniref:Uncharacterized protein n=1 Tax=Zea mays TaxID=4577 RepID=C4IYJ1_MAIZE|nr:unknown [Zea mays]